MSEIGHNSGDTLQSAAQAQLRSVIERVERLNVEKAEIMEQIKEVYTEAKGNGFDTKTIRKLVAMRKQDAAKLQEERAMLELYANAAGCADLV